MRLETEIQNHIEHTRLEMPENTRRSTGWGSGWTPPPLPNPPPPPIPKKEPAEEPPPQRGWDNPELKE